VCSGSTRGRHDTVCSKYSHDMMNGVFMCEHTIMDRLCAQSDLHYRDSLGV
jgi:hypothetical protein